MRHAVRPDSRPRSRRPPPDRLARAAVAPTTSPTVPSPWSPRGPPPSPRLPRGPRHRLDRRRATPTASLAARPSPSCRAALSASVSHRSPPSAHRAASSPSTATALGRAPRGRGPRPHCATGPSAVSAQWHPVKFYYFLIYSIHCKFKKLCRIHLNSKNYETNFVGMV
jgi:hypothetical protein